MLTTRTNRLLSFLLKVAVLPLIALYGLLMYVSTPSVEGGMEPAVTTIFYIAFSVIFLALIIVVLNFSNQLARQAKGEYRTP